MKQVSITRTTGFYLLALLVLGGTGVFKGGLYLEKHEGDTYQFVEMILRVAEGQLPQVDFMTPIGILALAPIALLVKAGVGLGMAMLLSQIAVGIVLLPGAVRVATSRLVGPWPWVFLATVAIFVTALVHGESDAALSLSMHYNRWAWALSYIVILLAILKPVGEARPILDGALAGLGLGFLALTKITYFVAFFPVVALLLLIARDWRGMVAAAVGGLAIAGLMTLVGGWGYWAAYLGDLAIVSASETRPRPGRELLSTLGAPEYLGVTLLLFAAVVALRQVGRQAEGLALLFLAPGFFFVTYQNFGNDPQWIYLVAILVFALAPAAGVRNTWGWDMGRVFTGVGIALLAIGSGPAVNLAMSPFRHLFLDNAEFSPLLPEIEAGRDLFARNVRLYRVGGTSGIEPKGWFDEWAELAERDPPPMVLGQPLMPCDIQSGMTAWYRAVARDLTQSGYAGASIFAADLFNPYPLFGDFPFLPGSAPWNYGGLAGFEAADYVIVPICAVSPKVQQVLLEKLAEAPVVLTEIRRTPLYILLGKSAR